MSALWGYSDFLTVLKHQAGLKRGMVLDTNVLVSGTYDLDIFHEETKSFVDLVIDNEVPFFCNVNVRSEFLEIHRRIIFTEAILDFEDVVDKKKLPASLAGKLTNLRTKVERRKKENLESAPLRLAEAEIKSFKMEMVGVQNEDGSKSLWHSLCGNLVGNKLSTLWGETEDALALNFLSLRKEDQVEYLNEKPESRDAMSLIEQEGLSSADAMILNMFNVSKFEAIVTSDADIAISVLNVARPPKVCFVPDELRDRLEDKIR